MTTSWLTSHTRRTRRGRALVAALVCTFVSAGHANAARPSYSWPVKPFDRQHPIRSFFGDPRIGPGDDGRLEHTFHFGIDIHAHSGTAVYATVDGVVSFNPLHSDVVLVTARGGTIHEYWHVRPAVRGGQWVTARHTVVGHVSCCDHVHFAERHGTTYVNPLRVGGLGPYRDRTCPFVRDFAVQRDDRPLRTHRVSGRVDLVVEAYDPAPMALPEPWTGNPVTPARLSWRLIHNGRQVTPWVTAIDFRRTEPPDSAYDSVYAVWTRQNKRAHPGRYRFVLATGWDSRRLADGRYEIDVEAADTKGNACRERFAVVIKNNGDLR
jgi:murein DD-endopeptidase MepM/ murein hydrolase activator NlpD